MQFEVIPIKGMIENAYLIKGRRIALVDTLSPSGWRKLQKVLRASRISAGDIEFILITHHHFDHCGNLARLKELSGATVIAGEADVPVIDGTAPSPPPSKLNRLGRVLGKIPEPVVNSYQKYDKVKVDRLVSGGEMIEELELEVIALPGHTPGGVGYYDPEGKRAFIGDLVSYWLSSARMPTISASESIEQIRGSQELLVGLDLETAYPGHGVVIQPNASKTIGSFVARKKAGETRV